MLRSAAEWESLGPAVHSAEQSPGGPVWVINTSKRNAGNRRTTRIQGLICHARLGDVWNQTLSQLNVPS